MALRKVNFAIQEYYHLYNRGVEKKNIFLDNSDYKKFLFLMYICNTTKSIVLREINDNFDRGETIVDIGAYCLMRNHFHILVREKVKGGITAFTRKLLTAYSMYFNKKYERTGKLWQGVFQSSHIDSDEYLKYMYSYIHLNPAVYKDLKWRENLDRNSRELFEFVSDYKYSSFSNYLDRATNYQAQILSPKAFPEYFKNPLQYKKELSEWLNYHIGNSYVL